MRELGLRRGRALLASALLAVAYVVGAMAQARFVNVDYHRHDQDSYLDYARTQADTHFEMVGNRLQMPALPTLLALFAKPGEDVGSFFARAKLVCVLVSVPLAALVCLTFFRTLPRLPALALSLVTAFFVFSFRAAYVQAELLSYTGIFALFLALCRMWKAPSWPLALGSGVLLAAAYLCKATALLGFYVFALTFGAREIYLFARTRSTSHLANLGKAIVVFCTFFAASFPYAQNSKRVFGSYLYNMSSAYVMWCDSWDEFLEKQRALDLNLHGWQLPVDQVPSFANYVRGHTLGQMLTREALGLGEVLGNCLVSHGYAPVVLFYFAGTAWMLASNRALRSRIFRRDPRSLAPFVLPYLLVHFALFGFYGPIAAGNRFALAMFLPGMFVALETMSRACTPSDVIHIGGRRFDWTSINRAALALLALELLGYYPWAIATHYSGG